MIRSVGLMPLTILLVAMIAVSDRSDHNDSQNVGFCYDTNDFLWEMIQIDLVRLLIRNTSMVSWRSLV